MIVHACNDATEHTCMIQSLLPMGYTLFPGNALLLEFVEEGGCEGRQGKNRKEGTRGRLAEGREMCTAVITLVTQPGTCN